MDLLNRHYISHAILIIGFLCYCLYIISMQFIPATIIMSISLLLWIAFNSFFETFNSLSFSKILSISGIILSISIFFIFAIEEVPFPSGAIIFHLSGIAVSLLILLLALLPPLFINSNNCLPITTEAQPADSKEQKSIDDNNNNHWEIATENDLESGDYEIAA